jgi:hypothetical protein
VLINDDLFAKRPKIARDCVLDIGHDQGQAVPTLIIDHERVGQEVAHIPG